MLTSWLIGLLETASPNIRWQGLHWGAHLTSQFLTYPLCIQLASPGIP
jgi:hypothetical protein